METPSQPQTGKKKKGAMTPEESVNRYVKKLDALRGKGVFDEYVNRTRAMTSVLGEFQHKPSSGDDSTASHIGSRLHQGAKDPTAASKAAKLEKLLSTAHEVQVNSSAQAVHDARSAERNERVRRVLGASSGGVELKPDVPVSTVTRHVADTRSVAPSASASPDERSMELSGGKPFEAGADRKGKPTTHQDELSVAEWMQKHHEHQDYPDAEKETRVILRRKDEKRRGQDPVERYFKTFLSGNPNEKSWTENAAQLSMEKTFSPSTLSDYQLQKDSNQRAPSNPSESKDRSTQKTKQRSVIPAGSASEGVPTGTASPGNQSSHLEQDYTETMTNHRLFLTKGQTLKQARAQYKTVVAGELGHVQEHLLDRGLHTVDGDGEGEVRDEDYESSNEGDDDMDRLGNRSSPFQQEGDSLSDDAQACNVIECAVVCLCQEATRQGSHGSITRDHVILRNVLLSGLWSLQPTLNQDLKRCRIEGNQSSTRPPAMYRYWRSWSKGVETLLLFDLELGGVPFSVQNPDHLDRLTKRYCSLHDIKAARANALMAKWRKNKQIEDALQFHVGTREAQETDTHKYSDELVRYLQTTASITTEDLSALDVAAANLKYKQREVAQAFLRRFEQFLPTSKREELRAKEMEAQRMKALEDLDGDAGMDFADTSFSAASRSKVKLRHVLLRYVGLLNTSSALERSGRMSPSISSKESQSRSTSRTSEAHKSHLPGKSNSVTPTAGLMTPVSRDSSTTATINLGNAVDFTNSSVSPVAVSQFINVFKCSWGRASLSKEVSKSEAMQRAEVVEASRIISLIDLYMSMLSPTLRDHFRDLVKAEKTRLAEVRRRLTENGNTAEQEAELQEQAIAKATLHEVERRQILDKYQSANKDQDRLTKLQKAIESSDQWHSYNALKGQSIEDLEAMGANPTNADAKAVLQTGSKLGLEPPSASELEANKSPNTTSLSPEQALARGANQTRVEVLRIRKLQELDKCWKALKLPYGTQIELHDKWNNSDVKAVDKALKLYKECVTAVENREAALRAVLENEKITDAKERTIQRHTLFSAMCAAGQVCEVAGRKLQMETEDVLMYGDSIYAVKLKEDFNAISRLLRT